MKNYIVLTVMLMVMALTQTAQAQASVNINIGVQPLWGPVGYDYVEYYYLPDYGVYYYVPDGRFVYFDGGQWLFASVLPPRFGTINYYSTYKVVINQPKAYLYYDNHKVKYAGYKGKGAKQVVIRNSSDPKYFVVKGHPSYGQVKKSSPAPSRGNVKAAPQKDGPKMTPGPSQRTSPGSGNKGGDHGGGNKGGGGGHGKGGGKPK